MPQSNPWIGIPADQILEVAKAQLPKPFVRLNDDAAYFGPRSNGGAQIKLNLAGEHAGIWTDFSVPEDEPGHSGILERAGAKRTNRKTPRRRGISLKPKPDGGDALGAQAHDEGATHAAQQASNASVPADPLVRTQGESPGASEGKRSAPAIERETEPVTESGGEATCLGAATASDPMTDPIEALCADDQATTESTVEPDDAASREATTHAGPDDDEAAAKRTERLAKAHRIWSLGRPLNGTIAERYLLEQRGLNGLPMTALADLRFLPRRGPYAPALMAALRNDAGDLVAVHLVRLTADGRKDVSANPPKLSLGMIREGMVRLGDPESPTLCISEGVETGASRLLVSGADVRICCGTLRAVEPAQHHTRVELIADADKLREARKLAGDIATALAERAQRDGQKAKTRVCVVVVPPDAGLGGKADLNDLLLQDGAAAVARAVEEAEHYRGGGRSAGIIQVEGGSNVCVARGVLTHMEGIYGPVVAEDGGIWRFNGQYHERMDDAELRRIVYLADQTVYGYSANGAPKVINISQSKADSTVGSIADLRSDEQGYFANAPRGIACQNGFIRFAPDGTYWLEPHRRAHRARFLLRGAWREISVEEFRASLLYRLLHLPFVDDPEADLKRAALGEAAGAIALGYGTELHNPKAVVLYGPTAENGKSQYTEIFAGLTNSGAVSRITPDKLSDERYIVHLAGAAANLADELGRAIGSEAFKACITGEVLPGRDVYKSAAFIRPRAQHVYTTNELPKFKGGMDAGVKRRLLPIEFGRSVPKDEQIPNIGRRIVDEEADLLLWWAVQGAQRLLRQGHFTVPPSSNDILHRWANSTDTVAEWAEECLSVTMDEHRLPVADAYQAYVRWCRAAGVRADYTVARNHFSRRLRRWSGAIKEPRKSNGHMVFVNLKLTCE
jgi:P4 family phage/plasmid primase-like protien